MPLNLTDFDQILNRALSEHMEIFQNVVKNTSPNATKDTSLSQDYP